MEVRMTLEEYERLSAEKAKRLLQIAELKRQVGCLQTENQVLKERVGFLEKTNAAAQVANYVLNDSKPMGDTHNYFAPGSNNQVFTGEASGKFGTM